MTMTSSLLSRASSSRNELPVPISNEHGILISNCPRIERSMAYSFKLSKSCLLLHKHRTFLYITIKKKNVFQVKIDFQLIINIMIYASC